LKQYEAMFLFDPTFGAAFEACEAEVRRIMERAEAELLFCKQWEERRLAFRVDGRKRGVYVLTYFNAPPSKIGSIERDVQLSENVLRVLVLTAEGVTPEMMEEAMTAQRRGVEESGDRDQDGDRNRDRDRDRGRSGYGNNDDRRPRRRPRMAETAGADD